MVNTGTLTLLPDMRSTGAIWRTGVAYIPHHAVQQSAQSLDLLLAPDKRR